jgi:tetratricopeptide (TPR) repeat protein
VRASKSSSVLYGLGLLLTLLVVGGCVYYNTFFNARSSFNNAEKSRKKTGQVNQAEYKKAIDKSLKVVEYHANSKYYDDALFVLGVSYFWTKQPAKAERRFRELLANYPNSGFTKDATLYLAKSKLELSEIDEAMKIFDELFRSDYSKQIKAEAASALGEYHFGEKNYDQAEEYFRAVRDSLGSQDQKKKAQIFIADGKYTQFRFQDALGGYLQILGMNPTKQEKYHALYRSALCCYRLQRIKDGLDYLGQLIKDPLYYDSLSVLQLTVADGYEADGDLALAEATYGDVANKATMNTFASKAYYRLGLLYQYDYDDLSAAKRFYDKSVAANAATEEAREALQRASDISKLDTFLVSTTTDSVLTQEQVDSHAQTGYLLAELYWFQLNKPDSAIAELESLLKLYPHAYVAPKAMMALAEMYREFADDSTRADSLVKAIPRDYPRSDYLPEALEQLDQRGGPADTGYAEWYFRRAENFLIDQQNYDSAQANYQMVVDSFPDSKYHLRAQFNLLWMKENYRAPGDSTMIFAWKEFADSFASTQWGAEARRRLPKDRPAQRRPADEKQPSPGPVVDSSGGEIALEAQPASADTARTYVDPLVAIYRGPKGEQLILLEIKPRQTLTEFEFPPSAFGLQGYEFNLYYQIKLDFSGKVVDYILKSPTESDELNTRAGESIESMTFNPEDVSRQVSQKVVQEEERNPDPTGSWYVYKYVVKKPDYAR